MAYTLARSYKRPFAHRDQTVQVNSFKPSSTIQSRVNNTMHPNMTTHHDQSTTWSGSKQSLIPNVYEPIAGARPWKTCGADSTHWTNICPQVNLRFGSSAESIPLPDGRPSSYLLDDGGDNYDWSTPSQLESIHTRVDDIDQANRAATPTGFRRSTSPQDKPSRVDRGGQRQTRRQWTMTEWRNAGDRVVCQTKMRCV